MILHSIRNKNFCQNFCSVQLEPETFETELRPSPKIPTALFQHIASDLSEIHGHGVSDLTIHEPVPT